MTFIDRVKKEETILNRFFGHFTTPKDDNPLLKFIEESCYYYEEHPSEDADTPSNDAPSNDAPSNDDEAPSTGRQMSKSGSDFVKLDLETFFNTPEDAERAKAVMLMVIPITYNPLDFRSTVEDLLPEIQTYFRTKILLVPDMDIWNKVIQRDTGNVDVKGLPIRRYTAEVTFQMRNLLPDQQNVVAHGQMLTTAEGNKPLDFCRDALAVGTETPFVVILKSNEEGKVPTGEVSDVIAVTEGFAKRMEELLETLEESRDRIS